LQKLLKQLLRLLVRSRLARRWPEEHFELCDRGLRFDECFELCERGLRFDVSLAGLGARRSSIPLCRKGLNRRRPIAVEQAS
jgi:hypothetical protein